MFLYLNGSRVFWQIPGTDVRLSRSKPLREVTAEELEDFTAEQKAILDIGIAQKTILKVNKTFIPKQGDDQVNILKLAVPEIQRKYVSRFILGKDVNSVDALLEKEQKAKRPRQELVQILSNARARILADNPEEVFYREIEEADEVIEGVIVEKEAPTTSKKTYGRRGKLSGGKK